MGVYHSLYVGAYMVLDGVPQKEISNGKYCKECDKNTYSDFCPYCGSKGVEKFEKVDVDICELLGTESEDTFGVIYSEYCEDLNQDAFIENGYHGYDRIENPTILKETDPAEHIAKFKSAYKKEIKQLEKVVEKVSIHFGVISYFS